MGGSKREDTDQPQNLVLLDGSGTTGCHGYVEAHREHGRRRGFTLVQGRRPAEVAVQDWLGRWWFLNGDGSRSPAVTPHQAGSTREQARTEGGHL